MTFEATGSSEVSQDTTSQSSAPEAAPSTPSLQNSPDGQVAVAPEQGQAPAYTPNYKFKFMDQEKEYDDWAKKLVNAENEKNFKELYEKAHGLDFVKGRFHKTREELGQVKGEYGSLKKTWDELTGMYQKGDLKSFFGHLKIPKEQIYKYAMQELEYEQLPQEQKAQIERQQQIEHHAQMLEKQNQALQEQYYSTLVDNRTSQLDQSLARPDVSATAQAFDQRNGQGAFREEVIQRGILAFQTTGKDISAEEAVAQVLRLVGHSQQASGQMPAQAMGSQSPAMTQQPKAPVQEVPVIPNVGSRNASPAKRAPKSIAELKQLAASM